ncbi:MAG: hypothetical protein J0M11_01685 [Anaerolineae bacterium]|nr:hypothetical protein [Anaerolineae bacterium]
MFNFFKPKEPFKPRKPHNDGQILTMSSAVIIHTYDGQTTSTLVITPRLAKELAHVLPQLAEQAERKPSEQAPTPE